MFIAEHHDFKLNSSKIWLSSPTMHGPELTFMTEAFETNWISTVGKNISLIEEAIAEKVGIKYAISIRNMTVQAARVGRGIQCSLQKTTI